MTNPPPAYTRRTLRGRAVARVMLPDVETGRRKDILLGSYGTAESRERYARIIAAWEAAGRRLHFLPATVTGRGTGPTITQLIDAYLVHVDAQHYARQHVATIRMALRLLRELHGTTPARALGPADLRQVRDAMLAGKSPDPRNKNDKGRKPWSAATANRCTAFILAMYQWAAGYELVPAPALTALQAVAPLRVRDRTRVGPVDLDIVRATQRHLPRQLRDMVELQLLTGMRSGELVGLRAVDIERAPDVWIYRPPTHKTAHRGRDRVIPIGPKAQAILAPYIASRPISAAIFSPRDTVEAVRQQRRRARKTPNHHGNTIGTNRKPAPRRRPGDQYTPDTYRRAIVRAADQADQVAREKAADPPHTTLRRVPRWKPHQLRHAAATAIRQAAGLEAASLVLGHASAKLTDAVYAERNLEQLTAIARRIG